MPSSGGIPVVITEEQLYESSVRAGGPNSLERGGEVVFQDDFRNGLECFRKFSLAYGATTAISWSAAQSLNSGFSALITVPTGSGAMLYRVDPPLFKSKPYAGIESSFYWDVATISFFIDYYYVASSTSFRGRVRCRVTTCDIQTPNGYVTLQDPPNLSTNVFHRVKMVVDFQNRRYGKLIVDGASWDISGYPLVTAAYAVAAAVEDVRTEITAQEQVAGVGGLTYIGNYVTTRNERI